MRRFEVLKLVNRQLLGQADAAERFLREICSAARLNHPNIVTAYAALQFGDILVFAMEYVEGEDLAKLLRAGGPLPLVNACHYAQEAAMGLQHACDKGMIHRDIKPANLVLTRYGKKHVIKILDFGLAKATREKEETIRKLSGAGRRLTTLGTVMGTPDYMAPEQILDAANADIRADVYSLGCTLYCLLAGNPPFQAKSLDDLLEAHHSVEATPLNRVRADVPAELAAVVARMMAKDPARRYQKPVEVAQALAPFMAARLKPLPAAPTLAAGAQPDAAAPHDKTLGNPEDRWDTLAPAFRQKPPEGRAARERAPEDVARRADLLQLMPKGIERLDGEGTGLGPHGEHHPASARKWRKWVGLLTAAAALVLLAGVTGLWVGGAFRVSSPEAILAIEVNEPKPDVYVDGIRITVAWKEDGRKADVRLRPGTRKVEVRKDGLAVFRTEVELRDGTRSVLTANLVAQMPPAPAADEGASRTSATPPEEKPPPAAGEYDFTGGDRFVHFGPGGAQVIHWCDVFEAPKQPVVGVYNLAAEQPPAPSLDNSSWARAMFSPDGRRVVTISEDRTARVWDAATGQALTPPLRHDGLVSRAMFSPNSRRLVTISGEKMARVWDAEAGKALTPPAQARRCSLAGGVQPGRQAGGDRQ
jgi:hypothetical protein